MRFMAYQRAARRGMTIIEMLVAMALSLIIILAVTQTFQIVGENVLASRAIIEMSSQLRATSEQLRRDLSQCTAQTRPWSDLSAGEGYFEYYEGPFWDMGIGVGAANTPPAPRDRPVFTETAFGDFDDLLMFTSRSRGEPFLGQRLDFTTTPPTPIVVQSQLAEIAWFTRFDDLDQDGQPDPGEVTLHRRVFLILPELNVADPTDGLPRLNIPGLPNPTAEQLFHGYDISVGWRRTSTGWVPFANSLENLSLRENRTAHRWRFPAAPNVDFPYFASRYMLRPQGTSMTAGPDGGWGVAGVNDFNDLRGGPTAAADDVSEAGTFGSDDLTIVDPGALGQLYGNDVIQSQVLAFDVKLYDPSVPVVAVEGTPPNTHTVTNDGMLPGDPGYLARAGEPARIPVGQGGFVDLYFSRYLPGVPTTFSGPPQPGSGLQYFQQIIWGQAPTFPAIYEPWPFFYEHDGVDQDNNGLADQGTNGFDDDGNNGVDDIGERETSPPYPSPLRGIQVRIRIIDVDSRQVRQTTVSADFVPE